MRNEQLFNELGISPLLAVELLDNLDLSTEHLNDPYIFSKLQSVIEFLKEYPEDTQRFIIKKATFGKQDKLKVMAEYSRLLKEKSFYDGIAEKINKEKSAFEMTDDLLKKQELSERESTNNAKLNLLKEEINLYHK
jgi:Mor family transcriptional regulator